MVNTSARPITVDGVRLDTLAWNVEKIERATAARRSGDYTIPNLDGTLPSVNDPLEPASFGLQMWLRGTDVDGFLPSGKDSLTTLRDNLDELLHLFGKRHALLEVIEQTGAGVASVNMATNPGNEVAAQGPVGGGAGTITRPSVAGPRGVSSFATKVVWTSGTYGAYLGHLNSGAGNHYAVRPNTYYTLSAYVYVESGTGPTVVVADNTFANPGQVSAPNGGGLPFGAWTRVSSIYRTGPTQTGMIFYGATTVASSWYVDDVLVEEGAVVGSYYDGATTDAVHDYAWTGTVGQSTSTRTPKARRRALCKAADSIAPDVNTPGGAGRFSVGLTIPSGQWEDVATSDWVGASGTGINNLWQTVTTLTGATETINDAIYLVEGPAVSPLIFNPATGMAVQLGITLTAGQFWRFNSATWASRYGAGLTLASADTAGSDGSGVTTTTGPSRAYGLPLTPIRLAGTATRTCQVRLSGSGMSAATRLSIRAARKYAA